MFSGFNVLGFNIHFLVFFTKLNNSLTQAVGITQRCHSTNVTGRPSCNGISALSAEETPTGIWVTLSLKHRWSNAHRPAVLTLTNLTMCYKCQGSLKQTSKKDAEASPQLNYFSIFENGSQTLTNSFPGDAGRSQLGRTVLWEGHRGHQRVRLALKTVVREKR